MRQPPHLPDDRLIDAIESHYAIRLAGLDWIDGGADSHAWVARGQDRAGREYVIKLRSGPFDSASLQLAHFLRKQGMPEVVAPLPAGDGRLWAESGGDTLILYPFIAGRPGAEGGLTPEQWAAFGRRVRQLHDQSLPPELAGKIPAEAWDTPWAAQVAALTAAVGRADPDDLIAGELASLWREQRPTLELLAGRAEALAASLAGSPEPLVLCHADLHTWNVLIDRADQLWIIDWDTAMFGRKERDLMFAIEGISHDLVNAAASQRFLAGYGPARIEPEALAYYRCAWAIQDCVSFGEEILLRPELGAAARRRALGFLTSIFKPGQIVQIALQSGGSAPRSG